MNVSDHTDWLWYLDKVRLFLKHLQSLLKQFDHLLFGELPLSRHEILQQLPIWQVALWPQELIIKWLVSHLLALLITQCPVAFWVRQQGERKVFLLRFNHRFKIYLYSYPSSN